MKHYLKESVDAVYVTPEKIVDFVAKEKAKELIDKFTVVGLQQRNEGIKCALICVDEILKEIVQHTPNGTFWKEVKYEIEKL